MSTPSLLQRQTPPTKKQVNFMAENEKKHLEQQKNKKAQLTPWLARDSVATWRIRLK